MNDRPWLAHYDRGVPSKIEYPKAPLYFFLEEAAKKYPDRACTIFKGAVISYKEMKALTDQLHSLKWAWRKVTGWESSCQMFHSS
jgi:long-chain acyl-CoA synthetase